jgi:hypothetical protein
MLSFIISFLVDLVAVLIRFFYDFSFVHVCDSDKYAEFHYFFI